MDRTELYRAVARPSGGFAMVAIDARESMRTILRDAGQPSDDHDLSLFKAMVARAVAPNASAVLCDPLYGQAAIEVLRDNSGGAGLIVAVDRFIEQKYGVLEDTRLDWNRMASVVAGGGVSALKLYLFWSADRVPAFHEDDAKAFIARCSELGVLSVLEGVLKGPFDENTFDENLVRAAEQMGRLTPDIYKTQMPTLGRGDDSQIERVAARVTNAAGVPWVVLSNGVPAERFAESVVAACQGGASGLLAGRGVWRDSLKAVDPEVEMNTTGRDRLDELIRLVDQYARPWQSAART